MKIIYQLSWTLIFIITAPTFAEKNQSTLKQESREIVETSKQEVSVTKRDEYIYPTNHGLAGTLRVRSAESLPTGSLTFGLGAEFYSVTDSPIASVGNTDAQTIAENLFVGYSPFEDFTIGIQRRNSSTTFGLPKQLISSLGDLTLSFLYSIPLNKAMSIAPIFNFQVASNFNNLAPSGNTVSVGGGGAFTFNLEEVISAPLVLHANLLYHMPQIRDLSPALVAPETFFNFSRFSTLQWSLGAEIRLGDFIPFAEFQQTNHFDSGLNFGRGPSSLTLGTRITPIANKSLCFTFGADVGLGRSLRTGIPFNPGYQLLAQVSYTVALHSTERKHYETSKRVNIVDRKFVIKEKIKFTINKATLKAGSKRLLNEIAEVIRANNINKLLIVGHTDSSANEKYNLRLSKKRAESVRSYLISQGINGNKLLAQGYGKRKPIASNLTAEGRAKNRRVEFFILE